MEAVQAVMPIVCIVMLLCFSVAPISPSILLCFLMGTVLLLVGMMFFTAGAEIAKTPLITIQIMGLAAKLIQHRRPQPVQIALDTFDDNEIIEL